MQKDPRDRNSYFKSDAGIHKYLRAYAESIQHSLTLVSSLDLGIALELIEASVGQGRIFVGGNGGSASISDHLCCDFQKGTFRRGQANLFIHSLNGSNALFTAIGNDFGYEKTLSFQLEAAGLSHEDVVILISSSGDSPNIIEAAEVARAMATPIISLTGFTGGRLSKMSDASLHIPMDNYGVIEDCHQAIMHILAQYHYLKTNDK